MRIISPESLVRFMESGKYTAIYNTFEDGYKSPSSIIILDNIERLIEYIRIGPRFSNLLLQTLTVFIKKLPPAYYWYYIVCVTNGRFRFS